MKWTREVKIWGELMKWTPELDPWNKQMKWIYEARYEVRYEVVTWRQYDVKPKVREMIEAETLSAMRSKGWNEIWDGDMTWGMH